MSDKNLRKDLLASVDTITDGQKYEVYHLYTKAELASGKDLLASVDTITDGQKYEVYHLYTKADDLAPGKDLWTSVCTIRDGQKSEVFHLYTPGAHIASGKDQLTSVCTIKDDQKSDVFDDYSPAERRPIGARQRFTNPTSSSYLTFQDQKVMSRPTFSEKRYIEYRPGNSNIILTVPHGGGLRPSHIPNRDAGGYVNGTLTFSHDVGLVKDPDAGVVRYRKDTYTQELGLLLAEEIHKLTGYKPHVILCHLYRGKLDVNCGLEKAAFQVEEMEEAWHAWHGFINDAKACIETSGSRGLMLDIHGHTHVENWVELGYTASGKAFNSRNILPENTSICGLLQANSLCASEEVWNVLTGEQSLGALIQEGGYKVVPSPQHPAPGGGNYYTGGYNTIFHGSHNGGNIDAIQLENPKWVRNSKAAPRYVKAVARAITAYLDLYYSNR